MGQPSPPSLRGSVNWEQLVRSGWLLQKIAKVKHGSGVRFYRICGTGDPTARLMTLVTCVLSRFVGDQLPCLTLFSEYDTKLNLIWYLLFIHPYALIYVLNHKIKSKSNQIRFNVRFIIWRRYQGRLRQHICHTSWSTQTQSEKNIHVEWERSNTVQVHLSIKPTAIQLNCLRGEIMSLKFATEGRDIGTGSKM